LDFAPIGRQFIKAEGEEELKMVAEKNPIIKEAYYKLQEMSEDEETRMLYEARIKAQRDEYSRIQGALREGRREGMEKGRKEGSKERAIEIAQNLKNFCMPVEQIALATGLSTEEITAF
jgi:predicted transposase/invertase (TIGR01784 family)